VNQEELLEEEGEMLAEEECILKEEAVRESWAVSSLTTAKQGMGAMEEMRLKTNRAWREGVGA
jgi:hypothetical protein